MVGAVLVWLQYLPHWGVTEDKGAKLACFSTGPAIKSTGSNVFSEALGTFMLVALIGAIFSKPVVALGTGACAGTIPGGRRNLGDRVELGRHHGFAINPARDLGPRIMHAILPIPGKGDSNWGYAWVPVVGGLVGGAMAGILIKIALSVGGELMKRV